MSVEIERIEGKAFCSLGPFWVRLGGCGLTFVLGRNLDTEAADSNGAGKSTLWKALTWCNWAKCIDGDKADSVIMHEQPATWVKTTYRDDEGRTHKVKRSRKRGSGDRLEVTVDGTKLKGSKAELQAHVDGLLGHDFDSFRNTSLYGQNDTARFADPRTKDSERKSMLHRMLGTTIFGKCHELARKMMKEQKAEEAEHEATLERAAAQRDEYDLERLEARFKNWEAERKERIAELREEAETNRDEAKRLKEHAATLEALQEDLAKLDEAKAKANALYEEAEALEEKAEAWQAKSDATGKEADAKTKEAHELGRAVYAAEADEETVLGQLGRLDGDACPVCTSPLDEGHAATHIAELNENLELARKEAKAAQAKVDAKDAEAHELQAKQLKQHQKAEALKEQGKAKRKEARETEPSPDLVAEVRSGIALAENAAEYVQEHVENAKAALTKAKEAKAKPNPFKEDLEHARERTTELEHEMGAAQAELDKLGAKRAHTQFWVKGFSGQGLPSFVLDSSMPYLTKRANTYLDILTDGDIEVRFSTQRELKSKEGEHRDEIEIDWTVEGIPGVKPSGGQLKKIEVAVDVALMDLAEAQGGGNLTFLAMDEVLDGLDREGRSRVLDLLQELRKRHPNIFVTSHESDVAEIFEHAICVTKQEGVSRIEVLG
jgi:DNA repair exonuclease SbcCD ATPase subunit